MLHDDDDDDDDDDDVDIFLYKIGKIIWMIPTPLSNLSKWYIHLKTHPSDLPEVFIKNGWSVLGGYWHLILIFLQ